MKYTCEITNKDLIDGQLVVQVIFKSEDGSRILNDSFITRSEQDEDWLKRAIKRKLKELEGLESFVETIPLGKFNDVEDVIDNQPLSAKDEYKADLIKFEKLVSILRKGFIKQDNKEFVELQQKLRDNFTIEYIDLF